MSAWAKVRKQVATDLDQLERLLNTHHALLTRCRETAPTADEVLALAAILHSFYTGVENLFKRVAIEVDGETPRGEFWHSQLLERMSRPGSKRPAVVSEELRMELEEYMDFRHLFRHAYTFQLRWSKMAPLVLRLEDVMRRLEGDVELLLRALESAGNEP